MHMRYALIALLIALPLVGREFWLSPHGNLTVHFFDVGQGDGALLESPSGKQIIIDGGPDATLLRRLGRAMPFFDRSIDLLVLTHPQLDHIAAFPEILQRYHVSAVLMTGIDTELPRYQYFLALLKEKKIPILVADPLKDIDLGDGLVLDIVWPGPTLFGKEYGGDLNATSIVLRALYRDHSILFTGDIEEETERGILASGAFVRSDIIKVPHHGSKTSSSTGFLLAVQPNLAVISAGRNNDYGHPHKEILERYRHLEIPVRMTQSESTITLSFQ